MRLAVVRVPRRCRGRSSRSERHSSPPSVTTFRDRDWNCPPRQSAIDRYAAVLRLLRHEANVIAKLRHPGFVNGPSVPEIPRLTCHRTVLVTHTLHPPISFHDVRPLRPIAWIATVPIASTSSYGDGCLDERAAASNNAVDVMNCGMASPERLYVSPDATRRPETHLPTGATSDPSGVLPEVAAGNPETRGSICLRPYRGYRKLRP